MASPTISLVTPSFNQGRFLEATLQSVLNQNYPALQYVVTDGGSTDNSVEVLQRYAEKLHFWCSEKDAGQYDALNKGFARTDGEIMGYLNSDDLHCPWTLGLVARVFSEFPEVSWLTTRFPMRYDLSGLATNCYDSRGYARGAFAEGEYLPGTKGFFAAPIQQESTFWRRSLWKEAGGKFSTDFGYAADFELWCRFVKHTDLVAVSAPVAGFRRHGDQKTSRALATYYDEAMRAFRQSFPEPPQRQTQRNFCRDRMPAVLRPLALKLGALHRAKVISHDVHNDKLVLTEVLV